ncbi:MAG: VWA domain-containing protein [Pleurocapsa sp. SU_196_0]|nr:VWA domain-containing protein [Pleurocapsa sp. SU_196_0]
MTQPANTERLRRWRLLLGGHNNADGTGFTLSSDDARCDATLAALYDKAGFGPGGTGKGGGKRGGLGKSAPSVARWLGDIREFFPSSVVRIMQKDAMERLNLQSLLLEPETLESMEPDVDLAVNLVALKDVMPQKAKATARVVVNRIVEELKRKLESPMRQAVMGSLNRAIRNRRPKHIEIDWNRTIRANLKHYQKEQRTIIPEQRIGFGRKKSSLRDIVLCIDQSGSMGQSVVYSGVFGAVLASLPAVSTRLVVFDTAVVDLTAQLTDPVDLLFGVQLGGGTDINLALGYCQGLIQRPEETILVLVSDLYEGGNQKQMLSRAQALVGSGVQMIALLALADDGAPSYDHHVAAVLANMGVPSFACTPDKFPDLMAAAINRSDISAWAAANDITVARGESRGK